MINKADLRLYFIMGSNNTKENPAYVLKEAINGGITAFQYREKGLSAKVGAAKFDLGYQLRSICKENSIPFMVNDDLDLAIALKADGVHIGQNDATILEVRKRLPDHMNVGVSVSTVEEGVLAEKQGADYLGVGPIFATKTKKDAREPIGVNGLQQIADVTRIPIVAIGGINEKDAPEIIRTGAAGIAVIAAISHAENIKKAALNLNMATNLL